MTDMNLLPQKKITNKNSLSLTNAEIHSIKLKLQDNRYINDAIYKLASILTNRIMNGGFSDEKKEI